MMIHASFLKYYKTDFHFFHKGTELVDCYQINLFYMRLICIGVCALSSIPSQTSDRSF